MSVLFPRLPSALAEVMFTNAGELEPASDHPGQIFAPVGGRRAGPAEVAALAAKARDLAREFGFPEALAVGDRHAFDRRTARVLVDEMDLSWSEAAAPGLWTFFALVALPDVTRWRFGVSNRERWIATDLTRHMWARAWWRGTVFAERAELLDALSESDLNQILERRVIGGDARLVVSIAQAVVDAVGSGELERRALIRDAAARLGRRLAFVDVRSLDDDDVLEMCRGIVLESTAHATRTRSG